MKWQMSGFLFGMCYRIIYSQGKLMCMPPKFYQSKTEAQKHEKWRKWVLRLTEILSIKYKYKLLPIIKILNVKQKGNHKHDVL